MRPRKNHPVPKSLACGTDQTPAEALAWAKKLYPQVTWRIDRTEWSGPVQVYVLEHDQ